jgi:hypothetical protein
MCRFSDGTCNAHWLSILQKVLLATISATGIFLVKDLLLEVIIIRQTSRMFDTRKDVILRQHNAFDLPVSMFVDEPKEVQFKKLKVWLQHLKPFFHVEKACMFLKGKAPAANDFDS